MEGFNETNGNPRKFDYQKEMYDNRITSALKNPTFNFKNNINLQSSGNAGYLYILQEYIFRDIFRSSYVNILIQSH